MLGATPPPPARDPLCVCVWGGGGLRLGGGDGRAAGDGGVEALCRVRGLAIKGLA